MTGDTALGIVRDCLFIVEQSYSPSYSNYATTPLEVAKENLAEVLEPQDNNPQSMAAVSLAFYSSDLL